MSRRIVGLLGTSLLLALPLLMASSVAGCAGPGSVASPYASPKDDGFAHSNVPNYFASHGDQGMMADMSISDVYFVTNSAALTGTGEARLERYAELLAGTGGMLNYDATIADEALIASRMETARCFLADATPSDQTIKIVLGLPGGRGMSGREALAAREVAAQPEPRKTAYELSDTTGNRESGN